MADFGDLLARIDGAADADSRVNLIRSLEERLHTASEIHEADAITSTLKACLRNPHQAVSSAALFLLPGYVDTLSPPDSTPNAHITHYVRNVVVHLVPLALERLGDSKEKLREAARGALAAVGRAAVANSPTGTTVSSVKGKEAESALAIFERLLKDNGLGAKSPKVRENSILVLPTLRQLTARFPLRPFVASLVHLLSDSDPAVRDAARAATTKLFSTAPSGAKGDLKNELEKQGTRKQTADAILKEVFSALPSSAATDSATNGGQGPPGSIAATATVTDIKPVYIATQHDLERTFAAMPPPFEGKESEKNWQDREQAVEKIRGMLLTNVHEQFTTAFVAGIKLLADAINKCIISLRTTLSMHAIVLIEELARKLGDDLDPVADRFLAKLFGMAGFTKRLVANAAQVSAAAIMANVHFRHQYLVYIEQIFQEKSVFSRQAAADHLYTILGQYAAHHKHAVESHGGLDLIDTCLHKGLTDPSKEVREMTRKSFFLFEDVWPQVAGALFDRLEVSFRKQVTAARALKGTGTGAEGAQITVAPVLKRRPGGPSAALLAAKKAAAAKLAEQRKQAAAVQEVDNGAPDHPAPTEAASFASTSIQQTMENWTSTPSKPSLLDLMSSTPSASNPKAARIESDSPKTTLSALPGCGVTTAYAASKEDAASSVSDTGETPRLLTSTSSHSPDSRSNASHRSRDVSSPTQNGFNNSLDAGQPSLSFGADDTFQLPGAGDLSTATDLMAYSSPYKAMQSSPGSASLSSPRDGPSTPKTAAGYTPAARTQSSAPTATPRTPLTGQRRSGLPRPASMIHSGPSPLHGLPISRHTPTRSVDNTAPDIRKASLSSSGSGSSVVMDSGKNGMSLATPPSATRLASGWQSTRANRFLDRAKGLTQLDSPLKSRPESAQWVAALQGGTADMSTLRSLMKLSSHYKIPSRPIAPDRQALGLAKMGEEEQDTDLAVDAWQEGNLFDHVFGGALDAAGKSGQSDELRHAAMHLIHRLVENQFELIDSSDKEQRLLELLFKLRRHRLPIFLNGSEAIMDQWCSLKEPTHAFGLLVRTLTTALRPTADMSNQAEAADPQTARTKVYLLGLRGLSKVLARIPPELVEDELPKAKSLFYSALHDEKEPELREAAIRVFVAAHERVQDKTALFLMLGPLDTVKQSLLTYYINKR